MRQKKAARASKEPSFWRWNSAAGLSVLLLSLSALGWLVGRYAIEGHDGWGEAALNTQYWSLKVHGAAVMFFLFVLGMAAQREWPKWILLKKSQRLPWIAALALLGLVILSGWLLYYGPTSEIQDAIIKAHWILGLLSLAAGGVWVWMGQGTGKKTPLNFTGFSADFSGYAMFQISFNQGVGPAEVKLIREKVQAECIALKMVPKNGFILLFVVDELSCNIMEHAHATWMELKVDTNAEKFMVTLRDDGVPFDSGAEASEAKERKVTGDDGERRLGLGLIGRLVDNINYSRDKGVNQLVLEKAWQIQ